LSIGIVVALVIALGIVWSRLGYRNRRRRRLIVDLRTKRFLVFGNHSILIVVGSQLRKMNVDFILREFEFGCIEISDFIDGFRFKSSVDINLSLMVYSLLDFL
jgi:hypothetical protein